MKRLITIAGIIILGVLAITLFSTCEIDSPFIEEIQEKIDTDLEDVNPTYIVTYDGNGNESGTVPVDGSSYEKDATVTVLGNTGTLAKTDYTFVGWNTAADGSGTNYQAEATFIIGAENVILYANWTDLPTYTVDFDSQGGSPVDTQIVIENHTVAEPTDPEKT